MKKLFLLIVMALILQSCATQPIFYHSEATLPYFYRSTKTVLELINDKNTSSLFQFGVITAKDNDTLSYVLLAPANEQKDITELADVNLSYSVTLLPKQVKEFIKILNSSADKWYNKFESKDGINYEFEVAPENLIVQQSENVSDWYSTLTFYFQNNEKGPLGTLLLGRGKLKYIYKLGKISEITDLTNMLTSAIKDK